VKKFAPAVASVKEFRPIQVSLEEVDGSFDRMLRRFIRRSKDDGVLDEVRDRRGFRKPSEERRRRAKRAPR
jgi:ribosomal protein S21